MRPRVIQFIVEHLVDPDPFAAQAILAEFGEPADVSLVHEDGSLTVYFAYTSPPIGPRAVMIPHLWRFTSMDSATVFRELVGSTCVQASA